MLPRQDAKHISRPVCLTSQANSVVDDNLVLGLKLGFGVWTGLREVETDRFAVSDEFGAAGAGKFVDAAGSADGRHDLHAVGVKHGTVLLAAS